MERETLTMLKPDEPAVILAPMEGVTDAPMRAVQGEIGAFAFAVSEFLRISHSVPPKHVFLRHVPEMRAGCRTPTGLPVQVQLLGGDPGRMAEAAVAAWECGATAIDLNFGCPAKTVNRHDGGATLLKYPHRIREIVRAVREALPLGVPVSAKMRLGWDSIDAIDENAAMAAAGGAAWITIHGRTRFAGYAPPIFWEPIGRIRANLSIPVVANGDIWSFDDFLRCRDATGCRHFMLGRGALANPELSHRVARELGIDPEPDAQARVVSRDELIRPHNGGISPLAGASGYGFYGLAQFNWIALLQRLIYWTHELREHPPENMVRRLKQWLKLAATCGTFADFDAIKRSGSVEELLETLHKLPPEARPDPKTPPNPLALQSASAHNTSVSVI